MKLPGKMLAANIAGEWLAVAEGEPTTRLDFIGVDRFPYIPEAEVELLRERVKQLEEIVKEELEDNRERIKGSGGHVWSGYSGAIEACESILERFSEALGVEGEK